MMEGVASRMLCSTDIIMSKGRKAKCYTAPSEEDTNQQSEGFHELGLGLAAANKPEN